MMEETATEYAPWYVLPADRKWYSRYLFATIIKYHLNKIDPEYPELDAETRSKLDEYQVILEAQAEE